MRTSDSLKLHQELRPVNDVAVAAHARENAGQVPEEIRKPLIGGDSRPCQGFEEIYDTWFDEVSRWMRALGAPEADQEDLAQEVFLVVQRRLKDFDGRNVASWLYRIAQHQVRDHRRRAWFKALLHRHEESLDELDSGTPGPLTVLEKREQQQLVHRLLSRMSETRRVTFVLYEIEGYRGEEIAALLGIPIKTVWTRLHHARKQFLHMVEKQRDLTRGRP